AGYIEQLEKSRDEAESQAATGDALAMEFEKFLRASESKPGEEPGEKD
ncbi:MAG: hypothetical protein RLZZ590_820, partial [Actinomycetota bacterium]